MKDSERKSTSLRTNLQNLMQWRHEEVDRQHFVKKKLSPRRSSNGFSLFVIKTQQIGKLQCAI